MLAAGLIAAIVCVGILATDVAVVLGGRMRAQTAADAAALAAAGSPADGRTQAARFAALNGAALVACICPPGLPSSPGIARVVVQTPVDPVLLPVDVVRAAASAQREPVR